LAADERGADVTRGLLAVTLGAAGGEEGASFDGGSGAFGEAGAVGGYLGTEGAEVVGGGGASYAVFRGLGG
jgi:hypothetical protein